MLRLVTIPISHYCEKARWALDRAGLPFREERHVQIVHVAAARRAGGGRTVPVLVTPEGVLADSAAILRWVDARSSPELRLYPPDAAERAHVEDTCRRFDERLGPPARRLMYVHMLTQRALALRFNNQGVPRWEDVALRVGWPLAARLIERALDITPGVEASDLEATRAEFDFAQSLLADGRGFLCGERFGAADLTFAALAAAVLTPPGYGVALPQPAQMDASTAALVTSMREHPAGRFALRMFAEERAPRSRGEAPEIVHGA